MQSLIASVTPGAENQYDSDSDDSKTFDSAEGNEALRRLAADSIGYATCDSAHSDHDTLYDFVHSGYLCWTSRCSCGCRLGRYTSMHRCGW